MHVDASDVPASSILAIVATLASVALLSFSLRVYTRGRLLRSLGTDDWLLSVATVSQTSSIVVAFVLTSPLALRCWSLGTGYSFEFGRASMAYNKWWSDDVATPMGDHSIPHTRHRIRQALSGAQCVKT
jgi:hypothetical protein